MIRGVPCFRDYDNPKRKKPFGWDFGHGNKRKYVTFSSKSQKNKFKRDFEVKFFSDRDAFLSFDAGEWRELQRLKNEAGGLQELEAAVRSYDAKNFEQPIKFSEAMEGKLDDLERKKARGRNSVRTYCERFLAACGDMHLPFYRQEDIQAWVDVLAKYHGFHTVNNHTKAIRSVFNRAIQLGQLTRSPAAYLTLPSRRGAKRVSLYSPEETQQFLDYLWRQDRALAAVYALLFFTGLRVSMVAPSTEKRKAGEFLTHEMINLQAREIVIPAGLMKSQDAWIIDESKAPANLWPWLDAIGNARLPTPANTFNKWRGKICDSTGLAWVENGPRRSCASYYASIHGVAATSELLGNTDDVLDAHYKVATFRKTAEAFFEIYPPKTTNLKTDA